ncbi:Helix-turn-helix domain-containing protein [Propionibacterium cyclohexanicum]|uniref:Helix-turn-helix domain-containing protein n=1 Tax=Propionibacterium cyclohexanicum TaxID=64702 RepID=A0A1H9TI18_9ACTN|nr:helix-turn-helix domain-containing protein [Propionibacterium cyclohexanicum]SER96758.1 Helix-turn-helix domain-containing protein [Propionibacterium cyclohexanicum]
MLRHQVLLPRDTSRGWLDLVGPMRFSHNPETGAGSEGIHAFFEGAGIRVLAGDPLRLRMQALRFSTFIIVRMATPDFAVEWTRQRITARRRFLFIFVSRGCLEIGGHAQYWTSDGGGLCIIFPGSESATIRTREPSEMVFFSFDEEEISPHRLTRDTVGDITPASIVFRAAYSYLLAAAHEPSTASNLEGDLATLRSLTREVARALAAAATVTRPPERLFATAQSELHKRFRHPSFGPAELAAVCGVSRSTLDRTFGRHDLQVSREIRRARVEHAMSLLSAEPAVQLDEVVHASGFGSRASMNRAFREAFGVPAATARHLLMETGKAPRRPR